LLQLAAGRAALAPHSINTQDDAPAAKALHGSLLSRALPAGARIDLAARYAAGSGTVGDDCDVSVLPGADSSPWRAWPGQDPRPGLAVAEPGSVRVAAEAAGAAFTPGRGGDGRGTGAQHPAAAPPSQAEAAGFADSAARRYSALMRWASSSRSSRMTMRQAASTGVPWSTSSRARAAMRNWYRE